MSLTKRLQTYLHNNGTKAKLLFMKNASRFLDSQRPKCNETAT